LRAILTAGFVAGALDIIAAFAIYGWLGVSPIRILQSISAGLLGGEASRGGLPTAVLGLFLQFFIATVAAWVYYVASTSLPILREHPITWGGIYGIVVWTVMNFIVVPLSAVPKRPMSWRLAPLIIFVHIVCVGIPIAMVLRRSWTLARQ